MEGKYNRRESWELEHGGAPIKCILDVAKSMHHLFDHRMAKHGLTSIQLRIIGYLCAEEAKGRCVFQRDIEDVFRIKRSSVTSVLQILERKGLLLRESVPEDARIKKLVLTEEARAIRACHCDSLGAMEQKMRQLFTDEEFQRFLDYMDRIDQKANELYDSKEENND